MDIEIASAVILSSIRWFYDKYANNEKSHLNLIELERHIIIFMVC